MSFTRGPPSRLCTLCQRFLYPTLFLGVSHEGFLREQRWRRICGYDRESLMARRSSSSFKERMPNRKAQDYLIRVNRLPVSADQILQEQDRISISPTKIHGACPAA